MGARSAYSSDDAGTVTLLLTELRTGNQDVLDRLLPLVYAELRRLANYYMRQERPGHTLQPTALVHEAFLQFAGQDRATWQNRAQFMAVAGHLMRRILVDHARRRHATKRDGVLITFDEAIAGRCAGVSSSEEILAVNEALDRLAVLDPNQARIVELRYFAGLSAGETAQATGVSLRTVEREWTVAKAWLRAELAERGCP